MDWQPGAGDAEGTGPDRDPDRSSPDAGGPAREPGRDPRLAGFARGDAQGGPVPSGSLALLADQLSGPGRRCPGATDNELTGLLQAWAALESWAASGKLAVIREMMRRDRLPSPGADHGDLPETWSDSLRYELAAALACSTQSAERTAWLAWELQARLPATAALLDDGTLTAPKAKAIADTFSQLMDADAATAETMISDQLAGKTYTQVMRLAEQAALTVDPELAEHRREQAQKKDARVSFFREQAGTAALSGRDLPPGQALAAMATVNTRAGQYRECDAFGDTPMDVLRAYAYLDLIAGRTAADRIANAEWQDDATDAAQSLTHARARARAAARSADTGTAATRPGNETPPPGPKVGPGPDPDDDDDDSPGSSGSGPCDPGSQPGAPPAGQARQRRPADLIVPLTTLLGLAERPGDIHGFGLLDPVLARQLAAAGAASPHTQICVTVTSSRGYAIGHGCARPGRKPQAARRPDLPAPPITLPVRLNLTIPAAALPALSHGRTGPWSLIPSGKQADTPGGFGTWTLVLPGGRELTLRLDPVPTFSCDHRYESPGYQPSATLRHLVQIRDGTCTFPPCNRHARDPTSNTPSPTTTAAGPAPAKPVHAAAPATASNKHPAGNSPSRNPAGTGGKHPPAASTPRNRNATPPESMGGTEPGEGQEIPGDLTRPVYVHRQQGEPSEGDRKMFHRKRYCGQFSMIIRPGQ